MVPKEEVIASAKWATMLNHLRQNRIEYLLMVGILHIAGFTTKLYSQVEGVCI
jgi:hypothetical protein